jgi:hypothetical protein
VYYTEGNREVLGVFGRAEAMRAWAKDLLKFCLSSEYSLKLK